MKKTLFFVSFVMLAISITAQVGIGTINPDTSSSLDIVANNKGVLIPRVSLVNVANGTSPIDTPAASLLVYNTNTSVVGGSGTGYYYWNGTQWQSFTGVEKIDDLSDGKSDNDGSNNGSSIFLGISAGENDNSDDNYNVGIGFEASKDNVFGFDNTAIGHSALSLNGAYSNTAIGSFAMYYNIDGYENTAVGVNALLFNTSGNNNTATGYNSLFNNTSGDFNTAIGFESLLNNLSGSGNIAVGYRAFYSSFVSNIGNYNIAIGVESLDNNYNGNNNIGIGSDALSSNYGGNNNTAIGNGALYNFYGVGDENIAMGYNAMLSLTSGDNNIGLGTNSGNSGSATIYNSGNENVFVGYNSGLGAGTLVSSTLYLNGSVFLGSYSGSNEPNDNRLYIENADADADNALIYGEFGTDNTTSGNILRTNSQFQIGNPTGTGYAFPITDGTANQVLATDGSGNISWTSASGNDDDWYEEGTTNSPNDINDDMFTLGNVAIGKNTADYRLDIAETTGNRGINVSVSGSASGNIYGIVVENSNTGSGTHYGTSNLLNGTGTGVQYGNYQNISNTGNNTHYGSYNDLGGNGTGSQYASYQVITNSGSGLHIGSYNDLSGSGSGIQIGTSNSIVNDGDSNHYGVRSTLNGSGSGFKYGVYSFIDNTAGGPHVGVYSSATKGGSYAGYFLGNVSIGTNGINNYVLPVSRGTVNQVIQTDGSGNLSWVDTSAIEDLDWYEIGTTTAPNSINDNIFTQGNVAIGTTTTSDRLQVDGGRVEFTNTTDASGTAGTGVLEIANSLRLDGNEIITNTNNTLYIQNDNNGDLRVDANTLVVDASTNNVGVKTVAPVRNLHLYIDRYTGVGSYGGLEIEQSYNSNAWTIYTSQSSSNLSLYYNNAARGNFNSATGVYTNTSDIRLKKNIEEIDSSLNKLMKLQPKKYHFKTQNNSEAKNPGFIAQDVIKLFPDIVEVLQDDTNGNGLTGLYTIGYSEFIPYIIKGMQEQQEEIDSLKAKLANQQKEIDEIKALLRKSNN